VSILAKIWTNISSLSQLRNHLKSSTYTPSSILSKKSIFTLVSMYSIQRDIVLPFLPVRSSCPYHTLSYSLRLGSSRARRHIGQQLDAWEDDQSQCVQPLPMWCWLSSGLHGMFCSMSSLDVLFFAWHRLESTTLQPLKVDGLVDAVCDLPCGIFALLQYLPIFLSQFWAGLLNLLCGPDSPHRSIILMKKALGETQTLRAGCSRRSQKISPRRRPPSRGCGMAKI